MIYIRPASISWTHCIHSVSCSFCFWQGSARTSHFCGASLHEISGRFQVVSGCFTRQRAWERSFPTKAPLAQSDPQLQDGLKARMQTWLPKNLYQRWCHDVMFFFGSFWKQKPSIVTLSSQKSDRPYERSCLPQCLSLTTFARNLRRRVRSLSVSVSRSPKKTKVFVCVCMSFVKFVTPCHLPSQEEESCDEGEPPVNYRAKKQSGDSVTTWFEFCGKLRAKVRRGIGRLLDLRPVSTCRDMPMSCDPYVLTSVVFVFHAYVSQVNVLGLGYTTHPVLEGNNLKTEEGQSEGQRQQPFLHESRVNHLAILWLVTFCDQTFPWNDCPRQNKDITTWPQQNLEGRAWIGGSMLSRKLMEIME